MFCSSPISANTVSNIEILLPSSTGRCRPAWVIKTKSPSVFMATVFPPAFAPVIIRVEVVLFFTRSTGIIAWRLNFQWPLISLSSTGLSCSASGSSSTNRASSMGCLHFLSSIVPSVSRWGSEAVNSMLKSARACIKSICSIILRFVEISSLCLLIIFVRSVRILTSS